MIDFGCGSGVLAIAAAALGAARVDAFDIDPQAITATRENARRNDVESLVITHPPGAAPEAQMHQSADVLVANILAGPLVELAPTFSELVRQDGLIALAGLLEDQVQMVAGAYSGTFRISTGAAMETWCRLDGVRL